jgi:hypothetical protein
MNLDQFAYDYNAGNWYDQGKYGGWASIGYAHSGVSFLGDGVLHNSSTIPIGYQYDGTVGWGKFWNNNFGGFWMYAYDYNTGEWFDQGQGSVGGWQPLGLSQMSAWFMGDGNVHTLDANWSYQLVPGVGGLWTNIASALTMFKYQYANSQWLDQGQYGGWQPLGSAGASAAFMGDGALHSLDTFWSYQYGPGTGNWWNTSLGLCQFAYNYLTGQWSDQGAYGGWQPLGPAILSAAFLGDGNLHSIGASWNYTYVEGSGYWHNVPLNLNQFAYEYGTGQWSDQGTYGGWQTLGNGSLSAAFMGDGHLHNLDLNWRYTYVGESGYWYNVPLNLNQFAYDYGTGQWFDQGRYGGWGTLGNGSLSAAFIGDGAYHDLGLHDGYAYEFSSGHAYYASGWIGNWTNKFDYNYSTGQWKYNISGWYNLGNSGMHCQFANIGMGDVGLRWSFDSSIDPASFGFNASNTIDAYIKYDSSAHGSPDRILYYDDAGHRVAEATIQAGSKGTRIAVDTSYVGASTTWDYYYSWWDSSTPYSPLVIVYDNSGNQLFKQISVEHIYQVGGSLGLWDGQAWIWEDANGNGQYDSNWSASGDRILHWRQQKGGTCGIYTDMNITESVLGNGSTQTVFPTTYADDTIRWFSDHYWQNPPSPLDDYNTHFNPPYNPSTMDLHDSIYNNYGGIYGADGQDYLTQRQGFLNPQTFYAGWQGSTFTLTDLVNRVESGKLCHVDLRAEDLWARYFASTDIYGHAADANHDGYLDAGYVTTGNPGALDHGVWVRGFQRDTNGNVTYVILEDSGTFRGAFARVPVEHFQRAWGRPTSQGVYNWAYFTDPPSGRTWSTAGINTWMFNPAVWSTSW